MVEQAADYLPIIDFLDCPSNYVVVTASAHGFGLSPATGKVVSDLVLCGETNIDIGGLGLGRVADVSPNGRQPCGWIPAPNGSSSSRPLEGSDAVRCGLVGQICRQTEPSASHGSVACDPDDGRNSAEFDPSPAT